MRDPDETGHRFDGAGVAEWSLFFFSRSSFFL
jgi:hypothetical protein